MPKRKTAFKGAPCPVCTHVINHTPKCRCGRCAPLAGDAAICPGCASILIFDPGLTLREPTLKELVEWGPEVGQTIEEIQACIREGRIR